MSSGYDASLSLQQRAEVLQERGIFLGGPARKFESAGRDQLDALIAEGMQRDSSVLDIGCGCLRAGVWLIDYLEPERYFGIEPNTEMLEAGIEILLDPATVAAKRPSFDTNADFDLDVFDRTFDFVLARSIWTHATRDQIIKMLDQFTVVANPGAVFLTSVKKAPWYRPADDPPEWVGRSHETAEPGIVRYRMSWIRSVADERGLDVADLGRSLGQTWLRITQR